MRRRLKYIEEELAKRRGARPAKAPERAPEGGDGAGEEAGRLTEAALFQRDEGVEEEAKDNADR